MSLSDFLPLLLPLLLLVVLSCHHVEAHVEFENLASLLEEWNPNDSTRDVPASSSSSLSSSSSASSSSSSIPILDYSVSADLLTASLYRSRGVPFIMKHFPMNAPALWTDHYLIQHFDGHEQQQEKKEKKKLEADTSTSNHFLWYNRGFLVNNNNNNNEFVQPTTTTAMTYEEWLHYSNTHSGKHHNNNETHYYLQLSSTQHPWFYDAFPILGTTPLTGSRTDVIDGDQTVNDSSEEEEEDEAAVSAASSRSTAHREIHCRFSSQGIIAEPHFDVGGNIVMSVRGKRRYILVPPSACPLLGIEFEGPLARHSIINWADDTIIQQFQQQRIDAVQVILEAGEALFIPSYWFHYIISLTPSIQCNYRPFRSYDGYKEIETCAEKYQREKQTLQQQFPQQSLLDSPSASSSISVNNTLSSRSVSLLSHSFHPESGGFCGDDGNDDCPLGACGLGVYGVNCNLVCNLMGCSTPNCNAATGSCTCATGFNSISPSSFTQVCVPCPANCLQGCDSTGKCVGGCSNSNYIGASCDETCTEAVGNSLEKLSEAVDQSVIAIQCGEAAADLIVPSALAGAITAGAFTAGVGAPVGAAVGAVAVPVAAFAACEYAYNKIPYLPSMENLGKLAEKVTVTVVKEVAKDALQDAATDKAKEAAAGIVSKLICKYGSPAFAGFVAHPWDTIKSVFAVEKKKHMKEWSPIGASVAEGDSKEKKKAETKSVNGISAPSPPSWSGSFLASYNVINNLVNSSFYSYFNSTYLNQSSITVMLSVAQQSFIQIADTTTVNINNNTGDILLTSFLRSHQIYDCLNPKQTLYEYHQLRQINADPTLNNNTCITSQHTPPQCIMPTDYLSSLLQMQGFNSTLSFVNYTACILPSYISSSSSSNCSIWSASMGDLPFSSAIQSARTQIGNAS